MILWRTGYNYDRDAASDESGVDCSKDKGMTQQSFAEEVDINTIVKRFGITGEMPLQYDTPKYGDFEGVFDFQSAMNAVRDAAERFMELPASVRAKFQNDPQQLVEFVADEKNREEAIRIGLIDAKTPVASLAAPVAAPAPVAPSATGAVTAAPTAS